LCYEEWPAAEIASLSCLMTTTTSLRFPFREKPIKSHKMIDETRVAAVSVDDMLKRAHHAFWETSKTWSPGVPGNPQAD
jgi:hypothetical protein